MSTIHFLNVLNGDCNIIEHDNSKRVTIIDVSNADIDGIYENQEDRNLIKEDVSDTITGHYGQKRLPENPIRYLEKLQIESIWRFIISHPDMDHLDGIRDLFTSFKIHNVWDSDNKKEITDFSKLGRFNKYDWEYYIKLRNEELSHNYFKLLAEKNNQGKYWTEDYLKILCPTKELIDQSNKTNNFNDCSYVILFTPPVLNSEKHWKILFCGDSHDNSWKYILENFKNDVTDIDVLIAPHHGRDSNRNYDFVKILNPKITLFGNASNYHLAYDKYSAKKLTNNQAGNIIFKCTDKIYFYVKNEKFRNDYWKSKNWGTPPSINLNLDSYFIFNISK